MKNRYLITVFHWLTSVILGSLIIWIISLTCFEQNNSSITMGDMNYMILRNSRDSLELSLAFGSLFSSPFLLLSFYIIPFLLKRFELKRTRLLAIQIYTLCCVLSSALLLAILRIVDMSDWWNDILCQIVGSAFLIAALISALFWSAVYKHENHLIRDYGDDILDDALTSED